MRVCSLEGNGGFSQRLGGHFLGQTDHAFSCGAGTARLGWLWLHPAQSARRHSTRGQGSGTALQRLLGEQAHGNLAGRRGGMPVRSRIQRGAICPPQGQQRELLAASPPASRVCPGAELAFLGPRLKTGEAAAWDPPCVIKVTGGGRQFPEGPFSPSSL